MNANRADYEMQAAVELIDQTLRSAGIYLAVEARDGTIALSGEVVEPGDRQAALDIAVAVAEPRGLAVEDAIEVMDEEVEASAQDTGQHDITAFDQYLTGESSEVGPQGMIEIDPDFTGDVGTTDSQLAVEGTEPYFPPVDPVVRPSDDSEGLEVVGGFAESAYDEAETEPASRVFPDPDDDLAQTVRRELAEDSATADLAPRIKVTVRGRIVTLRGSVETIEDAEEVEAVAGRVPGVSEVREELDVAILPHPEEQPGASG